MPQYIPRLVYSSDRTREDYKFKLSNSEYETEYFPCVAGNRNHAYDRLISRIKELFKTETGIEENTITIMRIKKGRSDVWIEKWMLINDIPTIVKEGWE